MKGEDNKWDEKNDNSDGYLQQIHNRYVYLVVSINNCADVFLIFIPTYDEIHGS